MNINEERPKFGIQIYTVLTDHQKDSLQAGTHEIVWRLVDENHRDLFQSPDIRRTLKEARKMQRDGSYCFIGLGVEQCNS